MSLQRSSHIEGRILLRLPRFTGQLQVGSPQAAKMALFQSAVDRADSVERRRLRRLREKESQNRGRDVPEELRRPKPRQESKKQKKRSNNARTE
jgi:hypothetical protein